MPGLRLEVSNLDGNLIGDDGVELPYSKYAPAGNILEAMKLETVVPESKTCAELLKTLPIGVLV